MCAPCCMVRSGPVRNVLASLIELASLGLCATGFAQPRDVRSTLTEAKALERAGNPAAALEMYRKALEASPPASTERASAFLGLATVETTQGKYGDARRHAADAARLFDGLGDAAQASLAINRQGLAALNEADYDEAARMFSAALERSTRAGYLEGRIDLIDEMLG